MIEESEQACCYAKSDKYWVTDPTGIAWETFHTLGSIPVFREEPGACDTGLAEASAATQAEAPPTGCGPRTTGKPLGVPVKSACC